MKAVQDDSTGAGVGTRRGSTRILKQSMLKRSKMIRQERVSETRRGSAHILKQFAEAIQDDSTGAGVGSRRGSAHILKQFVEAIQDDSTGAGVGTRRGSAHILKQFAEAITR